VQSLEIVIDHRPVSVHKWVETLGLRQVSDPTALEPVVEAVLAENELKVFEYRMGKTGLLGFFVGQVMRRTGGSANPALVTKLVQERLGA